MTIKDYDTPNKIYSDIRAAARVGPTVQSLKREFNSLYTDNDISLAISKLIGNGEIKIVEKKGIGGGINKARIYVVRNNSKPSVYAAPGFHENRYHSVRSDNTLGISVNAIIEIVSLIMNVSIDDMVGKCRNREFVEARHTAMYLCKHFTSCNLKAIGRHFGNRDHSTVIHAHQAVADLIDTDKKYKEVVNRLYTIIERKDNECRNESNI